MAKGKKAPAGSARPVDAVKHKDARTNIPTRELRDFVKDDESKPKTVLYPRDQSLDPQLVWKGKDEQDAKDLAVSAVPIYIQEKIHPQALVEDVRRAAQAGSKQETDLFSDFNGLDDFAKKVDFYHHAQHWSNRMILGDSLLVMTSLAEKERLKGKVQAIYFDPPYGIKFGSNWQVSTRKRDVKDGKADDATRQPEQVRAFRDTWQLGVHSYLSYLRDRLSVARELLTDTGSVFVQIGDENVHLVRNVLDEVFGSTNFVSLITFRKTGGATSAFIAPTADYILFYAKDVDRLKYRELLIEKDLLGGTADAYERVELHSGTRRRLAEGERHAPERLAALGKVFRYQVLTSQRIREARTGYFPVELGGRQFLPTRGEWTTHRDGMKKLILANRVEAVGDGISYVRYLDDFPAFPLTNLWNDTQTGSGLEKIYVVQTTTKVVSRCLLMATDPGDLILDPTCGSGTAAFVAEQWGRRWITIDTSRVALALARTRIMAAKYPYYFLADSPEGHAKEAAVTGKMPSSGPTEGDIRKGFVYERIPHVTLKSIANNPDVREGMTREQIDAAIARHAESESLFDRPYEDPKRVRVAGPFTVESLSPHRVLPADSERPQSAGDSAPESVPFTAMILENLKKSGVKGTTKGLRIAFDRLEQRAGLWIHGEGEYTEADGKARRVAVAVGPEHGTVGPEFVKEAAKEAVKGVGYDVLVVCGFAFDPHVSEETTQYGKLRVLVARMNPDLAMGDELLKKTGAGNLFTVFGEPDVDVRKQKDGTLVVEVKGVDVYDPTTGQVRSDSTDDIACWFIDTEYDGESFFVRHAYFTGAAKDGEGPYDKLKRALRAEIDEAAWSALYSTTSRPFPKPKSGKIAVKVINHYGDEVLRVIRT